MNGLGTKLGVCVVARRAIDSKTKEGNVKSFASLNGHLGGPNYVGCYQFICKDAKAKHVVTCFKHCPTGIEARPFIVNNQCTPIQKSIGNVVSQLVLNTHHSSIGRDSGICDSEQCVRFSC